MENPHGRWFGSLELGFAEARGQTVLERSRHVGPLRVQRPFREADGGCQVVVLNPPGGSVGGDELRLYASLAPGARALLTLPGAAKFYRSAGPVAKAVQHFQVADGARLEWLPQETIVFDGAEARVATRIELDAGARFLGWEITCLGRPVAEERFTRGSFVQRIDLHRAGAPLWAERTRICGGDALLDAPWGLAGRAAYGTFALHPASERSLETARSFETAARAAGDWLAATLLEHAEHAEPGSGGTVRTLVVRFVGESAARGREWFTRIWRELRPGELGSAVEAPRIWAT